MGVNAHMYPPPPGCALPPPPPPPVGESAPPPIRRLTRRWRARGKRHNIFKCSVAEPLFYGGSGSCWIDEKKLYLITCMLLYMRLAKVTGRQLRSQKSCKVP